MIQAHLIPRGIRDERVLDAMARVPRERFVPEELRHRAYDDTALPIAGGQTISQPFTVAHMAQALRLEGHEKVLEIGTGSGYAAAVLSHLAGEVHTIERIPELYAEAQGRLARLGFDNVRVWCGDGTLGLPEEAPFDAISVTAASSTVPVALLSQLTDGGRLVIPLGEPEVQTLTVLQKRGEEYTVADAGSFRFVPLIGEEGWREEESPTRTPPSGRRHAPDEFH